MIVLSLPMSKTIALIPARGGSKGIQYKNIALLADKPLLSYSIVAAKAANVFDKIYVSSEDARILATAKEYGADLVDRSISLAQDHSSTNAVIEEFIAQQELKNEDIIVLLQPTSPLRTAEHIQSALKLFKNHTECAALKSVCAADNKYLYAFLGANPYLTPVSPTHMKISRRQDLPDIYLPNGAIYIFSVAQFQRNQSIPEINVIAYVMSEADSIDIDTHSDLEKAEFYLTKRDS
jgi:CMP-N,N'-diacetyllegionaminic acid synthase